MSNSTKITSLDWDVTVHNDEICGRSMELTEIRQEGGALIGGVHVMLPINNRSMDIDGIAGTGNPVTRLGEKAYAKTELAKSISYSELRALALAADRIAD
jgi:hypothetical protein